METKVIIERGNDGYYHVLLSTADYMILGCGDTVEEAKVDFYNCYAEMKEEYQADGKSIPDIEFVFKYDVASFLQYYSRMFSLAGLQNITGINQKQLSHYLTGHRKPSEKTVHKMEIRIHQFVEELRHVTFN